MSELLNCKPNKSVTLNDLICGCIMGGAIGDVLGYPVRCMTYDKIKQKYGDKGITAFDDTCHFAMISDITKKTLYTANAIIREKTKRLLSDTSMGLQHYIRRAYDNFVSALDAKKENLLQVPEKLCWIYNVSAFRSARGLEETDLKTHTEKENINNSKYCAGLPFAAPTGCFFGALGKPYDASREGAEAAKITRSYAVEHIPTAFLSCLIAKIIDYRLSDESKTLAMLMRETLEIIKDMFASEEYCGEFESIIGKAIEWGLLRKNKPADAELIKVLGE